MKLLMKQKNTGIKWTKAEKDQLKNHLRHLSLYIPALIIFLLPFGSLCIPVLAEILERRNNLRNQNKESISKENPCDSQ
jgi:uncharacterized Tic20 family protein